LFTIFILYNYSVYPSSSLLDKDPVFSSCKLNPRNDDEEEFDNGLDDALFGIGIMPLLFSCMLEA